MVSLSGCKGGTADDAEIKEDLQNQLWQSSYSELQNFDVEKISVEKRDTNMDANKDSIVISATLKDESVEINGKFSLVYHFYKGEGWILDSCKRNQEDKWIYIPLSSVPDEQIPDRIYGKSIELDDKLMNLTDETLSNLIVKEHSTDLEERTDIVDVEFDTEYNDFVKWHVNAELTFVFDKQWKLTNITKKDVTREFVAGCEYEYDEKDYIQALCSEKIQFGNRQQITVTEDTIKEFDVELDELNVMSKMQNIVCNFKLDKKICELDVKAILRYCYNVDEGWGLEKIYYETVSIGDITQLKDTVWEGSYDILYGDTVDVVLTVTDTGDDWTFEAILEYGMQEKSTDSVSGSCKMTGTMYDDFTIALKADESLAKEHKRYFESIRGRIIIDTLSIEPYMMVPINLALKN